MVNNQMRITGLASGLDTEKMVSDLMRAERLPLDKLFQKKEWMQWQRDAYRDVNLQLSSFQKKVDKLRFDYNFNGYKANSSNTASALASSKSNAAPGSYDLNIERLAEVARVKSSSAITNSDGTAAEGTDKVLQNGETSASFKIEVTGGKMATIDVDAETTFSSLASKIASAVDGSQQSLGLRASFDEVTSSFVITSKDMGGDQKISLTHNAGANLMDLIQSGGSVSTPPATTTFEVTGTYGKITFDGTVIDNLTSNKVTVYGVELTLLKKDASPTDFTTITVESDTESIFNNIKEFVDSYNALIDNLNSKVKTPRDRDYQPLTDEQREGLSEKEAEKWDEKAKQGLLYNDQILRETLTSFRGKMYQTVEGIPDGQIKSLSQLGIKAPYMSMDGKLEIDENKLREAISNNPDEVAALFTSSDGIATRVYEEVGKSVERLNDKAGRPNTSPNTDQSTIGSSLTDVVKRMSAWNNKLQTIEDRYWRQFTAMEKALSKMQEQSNYLAGMMV